MNGFDDITLDFFFLYLQNLRNLVVTYNLHILPIAAQHTGNRFNLHPLLELSFRHTSAHQQFLIQLTILLEISQQQSREVRVELIFEESFMMEKSNRFISYF